MRTIICTMILVLALGLEVQAGVVGRTVTYQQEQTVCRGYLAHDDTVKGKRPGVLVVHEWWGLNEFARDRAKKLAGLGYVALAADMYGQGITTTDPQEAKRLSGELLGKPLLRQRAQAALQVLAADPQVDSRRLAAIGFCFGGTTVQELAYIGAELAGVAAFHGSLPLPKPEEMKQIKARILILHGAEDSVAPFAKVTELEQALRQTGADWQVILYSGVGHSFTNPAADKAGMAGIAYHPLAAARSWKYLQMFLKEVFSGSSKK